MYGFCRCWSFPQNAICVHVHVHVNESSLHLVKLTFLWFWEYCMAKHGKKKTKLKFELWIQ